MLDDSPKKFNGSDLNQSLLNKGVSDKFQLILSVPDILKDFISEGKRESTKASFNSILFSSKNVSVPPQSIKKKDLGFAGQKMPISSFARDAQPEVQVEFTVDNKFNNYNYLWTWLESINGCKDAMPRDDYFLPDPRKLTETRKIGDAMSDEPSLVKIRKFAYNHAFFDYQCSIVLNVLGEYEEPVAKFTYTNAFITELGELKLDYSSSDAIGCSFKFAFGQQYFDLLHFDISKPEVIQ